MEAVVYPPPRYTPVCGPTLSADSATCFHPPRICLCNTPAKRQPNPPNSHPFPFLPTQSSPAFPAVPYTGGVVYLSPPRIRTAAYQPIPSFTQQYSSLLPRPCRHHLPAERGPLAALSCCRYCMRGRHDAGCCCARGSERRKRLPPRSPSPPRSQTTQKTTSTIKATGARETACCRAIARAQRDRRR
jgi:hypothetical protein